MHYGRGQALTSEGRLADGIDEYRQALLFSPDNNQYRVSLAAALTKAGRLNEAQAHLEQLLQEDPTNGILNLMLARIALQRHRISQAIDYYQRAVYEYWPASQTGERRQARWELVHLLEQTGHRSQVIGELIQLYANSPADPEQKLKIGFLLLSYGATSEASQVFRDLLREAPDNAEVHRGLAEVYFSSGEYVSARHEFQRALHFDPKDSESIRKLALVNAVIDLDPTLSGINSAERVRRSQNLLRRVLADLEQCPQAKTAIPQNANPPAAATPRTAVNPQNAATPPNTANPPSAANPQNVLNPQMASAEKLLATGTKGNVDIGLEMQNTAQQLWNNQAQFCGPKALNDAAVDAVLARMRHE